jgi:hypothetical protein
MGVGGEVFGVGEGEGGVKRHRVIAINVLVHLRKLGMSQKDLAENLQ